MMLEPPLLDTAPDHRSAHATVARRFRAFVSSVPGLACATALVVSVLLVEAFVPMTGRNLWIADVDVFAIQGGELLKEAWPASEYLPGAQLFFALPHLIVPQGLPYTSGLIAVNSVLLILHIVLLRLAAGSLSPWIALALFLAAGPLSLFRFELFVSVLVLAALLLVRRQRALVAGVLLGLATGVKIYPAALLPVFLSVAGAFHGSKAAWRLLVGFSLAVGALLALYVGTGGAPALIVEGVKYHLQKPVAVQSTLGVIATVVGLFRNEVPYPVVGSGVHGLLVHPLAPKIFVAGFLFSLAFLSLSAWRRRSLTASPDRWLVVCSLGVLLSFLVWLPTYQPQYLLWPVAFTALLPVTGMPPSRVMFLTMLHAAALFLSQFVYPIFYAEFLATFYLDFRPLPLLVADVASGAAVVALYVGVLREATRKSLTTSQTEVEP